MSLTKYKLQTKNINKTGVSVTGFLTFNYLLFD